MTIVTVHVVEWTLCTETINVSSDSQSTYLYWGKNGDATGRKQLQYLKNVCAVLQHIVVLYLLTWLCSWHHRTKSIHSNFLSVSWWWRSDTVHCAFYGRWRVRLHDSWIGICPVAPCCWQWLAGFVEATQQKLVWGQYLSCWIFFLTRHK